MKKSIVRLAAFILPLVFSTISCGPTTSSPTYDGREFDISQTQDNSLTGKSVKVGNNYSLTISGTGAGKDYQKKEQVPWNPIAKKIDSVTIEEGITHIGDYFFYSVTNVDYFILPSTVTSVGDNSFTQNAIVYTFGSDLENVENCYVYSESRPTNKGDYFYMLDGVPVVWQLDTVNVLFIGNSFTYFTQTVENPAVPEFFDKIADNFDIDVNADFVVKGSHTLTKFANKDDEMGKIFEEKLTTNQYDYIILQEQSTTPINNYTTFENAVKKIKERVSQTQTNCEVILYETWGSEKGIEGTKYKTVGEMEADLRTAYTEAGAATDSKVHYVGKAFTYVYENLKDINIYHTDNRHQNLLGSYLSAAVHFKGIFGIDVTKCTEYCGLNENDCKSLLDVAQFHS